MSLIYKGMPLNQNYNDPRYTTVNNGINGNGIIVGGNRNISPSSYIPVETIYDSRYSALQPFDHYDARQYISHQHLNQNDNGNNTAAQYASYNDYGNYGSFVQSYPQQQRVFVSRNQVQQPQQQISYLNTRSPSIDSRTRGNNINTH